MALFAKTDTRSSRHVTVCVAPCVHHKVHVREYGSPTGIPIVYLHGGPGGGTPKDAPRLFDPSTFRVVCFDQRGCGLSECDDRAGANTTEDLVCDVEVVREALGIDRWGVMGSSYGSLVAALYAARHPASCRFVLLHGVFTGSLDEMAWLFAPGGASRFYPQEFVRLERAAPGGLWRKGMAADDAVGQRLPILAACHTAVLHPLACIQHPPPADPKKDGLIPGRNGPIETWAVPARASEKEAWGAQHVKEFDDPSIRPQWVLNPATDQHYPLDDPRAAFAVDNPEYAREPIAAWARERAAAVARAVVAYEDAMETLQPEPSAPPADEVLAGAQIALHFFRHGCFLPPEGALPQLEAAREALGGVPCAIIHGRHDVVCTPDAAWRVHRAWPGSALRLVEGGAHALFEKPMRAAAQACLAELACTGGKRRRGE